jgi:two-component system LytT family response regulator
MDKVTCMVVDDDRIDCLTILAYLRRYPFLECIGDFAAAAPALAAAAVLQPDVLFLDIDMPETTGLQLREQLIRIPVCVFVTAFPDYALEAFELAALDFLVKPIDPDRFAVSMNRLEEYMQLRRRSARLSHTLGADVVFIKDGHDQIRVPLDEILYLEALNNYTGVVTPARKYTVLTPISMLLKEDPFSRFVRIHRSYAVQKNFVTRIGAREVEVQGRTLPVGRTYKDSLPKLSE